MTAYRPARALALAPSGALLAFTLLAGLSCAGGDGPTGPPDPKPVASIVVAPGADTLIALGRQRVYTAVARDADGAVLSGVVIRWRSSDTLVARVDSTTGVVTAVSNGQAFIRAVSGTVEGTGTVNVIQFVATVVVTPGSAGLAAIGATQAYTAVARDSANAVVPGVRFLWISSNPSVATIDTNGVATASAAGTTTISASGRGVPAYSTLTVTQAATQLAFSIEPATVRAGDAFSTALQVEVRDAAGALVRDSRLAVTMSLTSLVPGATLNGARTVNAVGGIATFSNVWVDHSGPGNTLIAASGALKPDTSAAFLVRPGLPVAAQIVVEGSTYVPAQSGLYERQVQVTYRDALGNAADTVPTLTALSAVDIAGQPVMLRWEPGVVTGGRVDFAGFAVMRPISNVALRIDATFAGREISAQTGRFNVLANFTSLSIGANHACARSPGGVHCWGSDSFGQLLRQSPGLDSVPLRIFGDEQVLQVNAMRYTTCLLRADGSVRCDAAGPGFPVPGTGPGGVAFVEIASGPEHTCGRTATGAVHCWGNGTSGQLGDGLGTSSVTPVLVSGSGPGGHVFTSITAGAAHSCGVTDTQEAYCWGYNAAGELGDGTTALMRLVPAQVAGSGEISPNGELAFVRVVAGAGETTCGINVNSQVLCWGIGPLGDDTPNASRVPVMIMPQGFGTFADVSPGEDHACAITVAGAVYCWGYNFVGQVGPGATGVVRTDSPILVNLYGHPALDIELGSGKSCARTDVGIYCWGMNDFGALGIGTTEPTRVIQPTKIVQ